MKVKKGKRSEGFWPSLVMKKWLNIKPKVYDFSEDEFTENDSEDDVCSLKDESVNNKVCEDPQVKQYESHHHQNAPPKGYPLRHRRGKSETLRSQYINTKEVRVTIGTWNVAGRIPNDDLEIESWLCTEEPADMYIIGFQEVVPLNAGNVFGAESNRPIRKWEAIIRKTLNKSWQPEIEQQRSFSAPPSPVAALPLDCEIGPAREEACSTSKNLHLRMIYGIDCDSRFDWPEHPLDYPAPPQPFKLRRVLSSSSLEHTISGVSRLRRSNHSSGDLGLLWLDQQQEEVIAELPEIMSEEEEEDDDDEFVELPSCDRDSGVVVKHSKYVRIVSKQMVGIYLSVWVRKKLRRHVNNLKVSPVGVGLMGYLGNKGSVSISMTLYQSRMCFVCSHLTSGQKDGAEQRRNADVHEIIRRTHFSSAIDKDQPQTIPAHDQIFWFGDLNYRLNMLDAEVRKLVALKQWDELKNSDQLTRELRSGNAFDGWREGTINFPPTYKYEIDTDRYIGENPREGEKSRSPAWCDRILWLGKGIKQVLYKRADIRVSDHRPVSSMFVVEVEEFDHGKLKKALNVNSAAVHPAIFLFDDEES